MALSKRRTALLPVLAVAAVYLMWPERWAVNAPWRQALLGQGIAPAADAVLSRLRAPAGFRVTRYAAGLEDARFLRFTPTGDLLVSQPRLGRVTLLEGDRDGDGRADGKRELIAGLDRPHGLDLHDQWLYVAESGAVGRVRFDPEARAVTGAFERIVTGLPKGGSHWTRTIRFGPDGWLYVSIGSSCNVCIEDDHRRAAIIRYRADGSGGELYATGLRNAVGFDWRPGTDELYATDNGRDMLGDDFPPCELDRIVQGGFYGWPFANGDRVPDPDFGKGHDAEIARSIPPVHGFRAHNAPLGMTFVRGEKAPQDLRGAAVVALHGSWNRTKKDGYKVVTVHFDAGGHLTERDLLTGFLKDEAVIGRPVDVAEGLDGALYVSDDYGGAVFRVAAGQEQPGAATAPEAASSRARDPLLGMPAQEAARHAANGRRLYATSKCATCHETETPPPGMVPKPLRGLNARYDLATLSRFLEAPTPPMPVLPLSADERRDLATYLLTREER